MAILTKSGANKILRRLMENGEMTPELENDIQRLQDNFAEIEGILSSYGETQDGENLDEYDYAGKEVSDNEGGDYKEKYETMKQRYLDRFFGGVEPKKEGSEIEENTEETEETEETEKSIDDLFEKKGVK